jgi:hypothetical protein
METKILLEEGKLKVIAFYASGRLMWTRTYVMDDEGFVEKMFTATPSGTVDLQ